MHQEAELIESPWWRGLSALIRELQQEPIKQDFSASPNSPSTKKREWMERAADGEECS